MSGEINGSHNVPIKLIWVEICLSRKFIHKNDLIDFHFKSIQNSTKQHEFKSNQYQKSGPDFKSNHQILVDHIFLDILHQISQLFGHMFVLIKHNLHLNITIKKIMMFLNDRRQCDGEQTFYVAR